MPHHDDDDGNGNGRDENGRGDRSRSPSSGAGGIDVATAVERISARYGADVARITEMAARERARKEADIRELKRRLRASRVTEGAVVLTPDEAKVWEKVKALGEPSEIEKRIADGQAATERLTAMERERADAEVAALASYNPELLARLRKSEGFVLEVREVKHDGKTQRVPYARKTGEDGTPTGDAMPLTEYAEKHLTLYLPALVAQQDGNGAPASGSTSANGTGTPATGAPKRFPATTSGTANGRQPSVFDRIRAEKKAEREAAREQAKGVEERLGLLRQ